MNRAATTIIVVLTLIAGVLFVAFRNPTIIPPVETPSAGNTTGGSARETPGTAIPSANEMITVTSPKEGDTVDATNGFTVTGQAKGNWYFEATAPVSVHDKNGAELARTYISAQGEWMNTNFVPFKGTIPPFVTNGATQGYIEFENSNPSDLEANHRSIRLNVSFPVQTTQKIKLYYGNTKNNLNAADCSKVYSVERTVPKTSAVATLALRTLLKGPTDAEIALGYTSAFGNGSGEELKSLTVTGGVATADFTVLPPGGSCLVTEARAQIEQTFKQFPTVKSVKILLNGSAAAALQP